jgi:hypothetical protein
MPKELLQNCHMLIVTTYLKTVTLFPEQILFLHHPSAFHHVTVSLTKADSVADTEGQHGNDHPAVVIDLPTLECECTFLHGASTLGGSRFWFPGEIQ